MEMYTQQAQRAGAILATAMNRHSRHGRTCNSSRTDIFIASYHLHDYMSEVPTLIPPSPYTPILQ